MRDDDIQRVAGTGRWTGVLDRAVAAAVRTRRVWPALLLCSALAAAQPQLASAQTTPPDATLPAPGPATRTTSVLPVQTPDVLEGRTIQRVEVEGVVRTDSRVVLDQVRAQAGQNYSRRQVDVDVRSVAALGRFSTVKAEVIPTPDNKVIVRFVVQERPIVTTVEILGNQKLNDEKIREVVTSKTGASVDPFIIQSDIRAIEELYKRDGYNFARVTVDKDALDKQGIVRYRIIEGPRTRVSAIKFDGNASLKATYLKWKIKTKTYIWIFQKGLLNDDDLDADVATIHELYVGKGFLDARVSRSLVYSEDKKKVTVRFAVIEGPKYKVGKILLAGNKVFSNSDLLDGLALTPGAYIERDRVDASQKKIEDKYGHEGYIYRTVEMHPAYTDTVGVVDVNYTINEGQAYSVDRVIVRGNNFIQDRVIRRQVRVYPDQTYDTVLVRKSQERIKGTRLFTDVKITPIGNNPDSRDALVEVQEGGTGKFMIGAGLSTNSGLIGQISVEQNNFDITNTPNSFSEFIHGKSFTGAGQYFQIQLEPGLQLQRYRVSFQEPYLLDTPYSFANDAYFFTRYRESWHEKRIGDIVTFGRRFGDVWSVTVALRAEQVSISNAQYFTDAGFDVNTAIPDANGNLELNSAQQIVDAQGNHFLTSIKPGIVRDTTDSRIFPTTGSRASFSWEQYGAMGGAVTMSKLVPAFNWYYPLYTDIFDRKTVFSQRNEIGYIPFGTSPFYERFYAGGIGSIRGFKFRGISPREGPLRDPVGGDFSWVSTAEVNYPIYENIVRGVVFADVGTIENQFSFQDIRCGVGAGVRLTIPFLGQLPLAVDLGYPLRKAAGDQTQLISFSMGIPF